MTSSEYINHPVHQKIEQFYNRIKDKEVIEKIGVDTSNFLNSAIIYIVDKLKVSHHNLLLISELTAVSAEFENSIIYLNEFITSNNAGHINNLTNSINASLSYIRTMPVSVDKPEVDFSKSVATFQDTLQAKYSQTENTYKEINEKIKSIHEQIEERKDELKSLEENIITKQTDLQTLSTSYQTKLESAISDHSKQVTEDRNKFRAEIDTDREKIKTDTTEIIKDLERKLADATKLVNVIGNTGVTGNYQNIANHHKNAANLWRILAIFLMLILSTLLICSIWMIGDVNYDWHKAIIRIIAVAILIYPATYAARESSKHRQLENSNRKAELELAAINPFIEILDETKKQAIKEKLVEKYFGNNSNSHSENDNENVSVEILEKIAKIIASVKK